MVQKVNPSYDRPADSFKTAGTIALAGGSSEGWISPSSETTIISVEDTDIDDTVLNAFVESSSSTSFDVTIDPGEAFVYGSWLAIDSSTTVTLSSSTAAQTVYVGWDEGVTDSVIIGLDADFTSTDQRIPLYDFTTDGSGVTSVTDRRTLGKVINIGTDFEVNYDSASGDLRWTDTTNATDVMALNQTSGDLDINGEITENASL